ncbi:hypothetical protein FNV43_RR24885 [Rhamnella rubrinervis]|uniref:DUF4378 domain-containing protein n=1 Tax=Rhamnella rubrinervis TaxID=2594499 RepID=A0A8K0GLM6_9ROSA|nr:hypothetical protein FNV43_RR24885 [Rhamnella rubrinervis]
MDSSRSTPSVIARLMGLDELPPQQPVRKPQRVLSESYLQRVASIGVREKRHKHHPLRMNFEEKKQFKRVEETTKRDGHLDLSDEKGKANLCPLVEKVAVTRQKCIYTKCGLPDEKLRTSEEFQDSSDVIDSKNDRFQIYLPEGNSSSIKNVHDLQGSIRLSHSEHTTVLKSSCTSQSIVDNCRKSESKTGCGYCSSLKKHEHGTVTGSFGDLGLNMHKFVRSQFVLNNFPRTRIVVLKPKHGKAENYPRYFSSLSSKEASLSGDNIGREFPTPRKETICDEVKERKNLDSNLKPTRQQPIVSRDLLEKVTGRIRSKKAGMLSRLGSRVGDTFAEKYELLMPPSSSFHDCNNRNLSFSNSDAYVTGEAMKQLLERWEMNKRSEEVGLVSRGSTLGEMLAMPNHNLRPRNHKLSRHGKKDLDLCKFSTKQFKDDLLSRQWYVGQEESAELAQHKSMKHNGDQEDGSEPRKWKNNCEKSQGLPCLNSDGGLSIDDDGGVLDDLTNTLERNQSDLNIMHPHSSNCSSSIDNSNSEQETWAMKDEKKHNPEDGYISQENTFQELSISTVASVCMVDDMVVNADMKVAGKPSGKIEKEHFMSTTCNLSEKDDSSGHSIGTTIQQETSIGLHEECSVFLPCSFIEPDSLAILEEAYQPSPVSVLEPPFTEEFSSDDLCSLQRHLQHLKSNSLDTHSEGPGMIVSSDDETEEGSAGDSKETVDSMRSFRVEESRDFSYLLDVLTEAGFHGRNLKVDFSIFHTPECPISLSVFETLEKKFGDQMSWKRSERRLLFDRINAGLTEILLPCIGVPTWARPVTRRLSPSSDEDMIEEDLWMMLVNQEKEASKDSVEKVLGNEVGKLELGDDIDAIAKEIERWLIDELAAELLL